MNNLKNSVIVLCCLIIFGGILILCMALSVSCAKKNPLSPSPIQEGLFVKPKIQREPAIIVVRIVETHLLDPVVVM